MSDLQIALTPPETLARFEAVVHALLEREGRLTGDLRSYLDRKAAALGVHHLDASRTIEELWPGTVASAAISAAADTTHEVETVITRRDGSEMVWVPSGTFTMDGGNACADERPPHQVRITCGFWLYRTPVTHAQYRRIVESYTLCEELHRFFGEKPIPAPAFWDKARFQSPDQPVVGISWDEARAYCHWACVLLPTEASGSTRRAGRAGESSGGGTGIQIPRGLSTGRTARLVARVSSGA